MAGSETTDICVMSEKSITEYIKHETEQGASENALRRYRRFTASLYEWLPENKRITADQLHAWRNSLKVHGYAPQTELNYIKGINRYLGFIGRSDLRICQGRAKDIAGKRFGYLTAVEPTGEKNRKDVIWRCSCSCGKEVKYPATRLLTGNTVSCGCLKKENLKRVNKYYNGTSLRQSLNGQVSSTRAVSGYTGVTIQHGRWKAYIKYQGQLISLGSYRKLEDAVKARAAGKEFVRSDALALLEQYEELHRDDPMSPSRTQIRQMREVHIPAIPALPVGRAVRSNNTSGHPGVYRKRDKWSAKIAFQKNTYLLGTYEKIEEAIAARQEAEKLLREDPGGFRDKYRK